MFVIPGITLYHSTTKNLCFWRKIILGIMTKIKEGKMLGHVA